MRLASLRCRSARFDDERLNQKVKIAALKNSFVVEMSRAFICFGLKGRFKGVTLKFLAFSETVF